MASQRGKIYVSVNGGASFSISPVAGLPVSGNSDLDAVPGVEGELWFAGGDEEEGPYGLWHSTDSGATFTKLANVEEADSIGFGKAKTWAECCRLVYGGTNRWNPWIFPLG